MTVRFTEREIHCCVCETKLTMCVAQSDHPEAPEILLPASSWIAFYESEENGCTTMVAICSENCVREFFQRGDAELKVPS